MQKTEIHSPFFPLAAIFIAVIFLQFIYERVRTEYPEVPLSTLPAPVIKVVDLGLHEAASSLLWIKMTQDVYTWLSQYQNVARDIHLINDIDPKWSYPYAFAAIMLPGFGQTEEAVSIGSKGVTEAEPDWRIPYYLATTYHAKKDRLNAAKYFDQAARTAGAPENITRVAANYGSNQDAAEEMKQIWKAIEENSKDEQLRERAELYIAYIEYRTLIDSAKTEYKKRFGYDAKSPKDLIQSGILKELPENPFTP
jgi:hypothetical protein